MDEIAYLEKQKEQLNKYEALCLRCGSCCGIGDGDPCVNLIRKSDNKYYCKVYNYRLGRQSTIYGKTFTCVPIRSVIKFASPPLNCAYLKTGL